MCFQVAQVVLTNLETLKSELLARNLELYKQAGYANRNLLKMV